MRTTLATVLTVMTLTFSVIAAHAGLMGTADVSYDIYDAKTINTSVSGNHGALEFDVDVTIPDLGLDDYDTFGYCVDVDQSISTGTYSFNFASLSEMQTDAFYLVAWLVDNYAPGNDVDNDYDAQLQAAALQGLIWETLNGSAYSVTNSGQIAILYNQYKSGLAALTLTNALKAYLEENYLIAINDTKQDLIVKVPHSNPVPEPATMVLLGAGLTGLAGMRRSRKLNN